MKHCSKALLLAAALLLCLTAAACGGEQTAGEPQPLDEALDAAITSTLRARADSYYEGEYFTTAYYPLSAQETDAGWEVYVVASEAYYSFLNDHFVSVSGSGAIPCKLTFTQAADGQLALAEYWQPSDGSLYEDSIRETFPADLQDQALQSDRYSDRLTEQKTAQAQAYLDRIGRTAEIGSYGDFDFPLATDQGMSVPVSNALLARDELSPYPIYLGTEERVEDGIRWVYETAWEHDENGNGTATYTKYCYDDGEIADQISFLVQGDTYEKIGG